MPADEQLDTTERTMYLLHQIRVHTGEAMAAALADFALTGTQALILETLLENGATSAAELGRRCLISRQALSAPLNDLERRSLVRRPPSDVSVRQRPSSLTDEGAEIARSIRERVSALDRASTQAFTADELSAFHDGLRRYSSYWTNVTEGAKPAATEASA